MQLAQFHAEWVIYYPHPSAVEGLPIKFHTFNVVGKPQALIYSNLGLDIFKLATSILIILIPIKGTHFGKKMFNAPRKQYETYVHPQRFY